MSYNENAYNEAGYNESEAPEGVEAPTSLLTFDGFDCDNQTYMFIENMKFRSAPQREIDQFNIPRADGIRIANVYERAKIIEVTGWLEAASETALETYIDTVKKSLRGINRQLVTVWGGKTRVYTGTLMNMGELFADAKRYHIDYIPFKLEFICEGAATDWSYGQWTEEITAAEDTLVATGNGTTEGKPVIIVVFSASTGVTSLSCSIDENGQTIGYSGALAAGDALVFDCENEIVTLNGVEVDFTGYFPVMELDTNTFRFITDGSSRTFRVTIKSKHAYL